MYRTRSYEGRLTMVWLVYGVVYALVILYTDPLALRPVDDEE